MPFISIILYSIFLFIFFLLIGSLVRDNYAGKIPYLAIMVLLFLFSALRTDIGKDYLMYEEGYNHIFYDSLRHMEPFWQWLRKVMISHGVHAKGWFIITSAAFVILSLEGYRKESKNLAISLLAFILIVRLYFESFNSVRQSIAQAIILFSFPAFRDKQYIKVLLIIAIAFCMHSSAAVMLILLPLCFCKYRRWIIAAVLIGSCFVFPDIAKFLIEQFGSQLDKILGKEGNYLTNVIPAVTKGEGTGLLQIINLLFALYFLYRQKEWIQYMPQIHPYLNAFFISIAISNTFLPVLQVGNRLMYYTFFTLPILLSYIYECKLWKDKILVMVFILLQSFFTVKNLLYKDVNSPRDTFWRYNIFFMDKEKPMQYPDENAYLLFKRIVL